MDLEKRTLAFVSGDEEEQERQKKAIKYDNEGKWLKPESDDDYFTDWDAMMRELRDHDLVVVTDLRALGDDDIIVKRLSHFAKYRDCHYFAVVDREQNPKVQGFLDEASKNFDERLLLLLREECAKILHAEDKPTMSPDAE